MEIYLTFIFLTFVSGLVFVINAICAHTWNDLAEILILAVFWWLSLFYEINIWVVWGVCFALTVWNGLLLRKLRKQGKHDHKAWIRGLVIPIHMISGYFFIFMWQLSEQM